MRPCAQRLHFYKSRISLLIERIVLLPRQRQLYSASPFPKLPRTLYFMFTLFWISTTGAAFCFVSPLLPRISNLTHSPCTTTLRMVPTFPGLFGDPSLLEFHLYWMTSVLSVLLSSPSSERSHHAPSSRQFGPSLVPKAKFCDSYSMVPLPLPPFCSPNNQVDPPEFPAAIRRCSIYLVGTRSTFFPGKGSP